jgi:glucose/mannose transport system substrate-binding protein
MTDTGGPGRGASRRAVLGTAATGTAAAVAGCLGGDGDDDRSSQTTTAQPWNDSALEVLHAWTGGDGAVAVEELTSRFEAAYAEMNTNFRPIGGTANENLNSVITRRLSNENPPSSFQAWPGENLRQYEDALADVTSVWTDNGYVEKMNDMAASLCQQGEEYRSIPLGSHRLNNLFYNVSVLEEAGVDPGTLTDVDALLDALAAVDERTDAVPMAHAMKAPWTNLQLWVEVLLSQEGYEAYMDFVRGEGDVAAVERALETTATILDDYINDDAPLISYTDANQKLMDGDAAFIHQGNWVYSMYRAPDSGVEYGTDWDWVTFPGTENMYVLHIDAFTFPSDNPTPDKRDVWAEFLGTRDAQVAFNNRKGSVPLRMDVDSDRLTDFLATNYEHLVEKARRPPTLAHGLAVSPDALDACKSAVAADFMGSYDASATAEGLIEAVSE